MTRLRLGLLMLAVLVGTLAYFASGHSNAQKDSPAPKGFLPANWKKIGLTEDQIKTIYKIQAGFDTKTEALKQQLADLKKEEKAELEKVLTPAQKDKLKEILIGGIDKDTPTRDKGTPKDAPKDTPKPTDK